MVTARFIGVGRGKPTWEKEYELNPPDYALLNEAKKNLMSKDVELIWTEPHAATVAAGMRDVGEVVVGEPNDWTAGPVSWRRRMSQAIGSRVGALLSSSATCIELLGYGVYEGRKVPPGNGPPWSDENIEVAKGIFAQLDAASVEEIVIGKLEDVERRVGQKMTTEQRDAFISMGTAAVIEDRAADLNTRVDKLLHSALSNPCILLDSGKRVWGRECWWGPEDIVKDQLAKADQSTIVIVDIDEVRDRVAAEELAQIQQDAEDDAQGGN